MERGQQDRAGQGREGHAHGWTSESQASPFSTIVPFGKDEFILSLDHPALQFLRLGILKLPNNLTTSVSADPLAIEINVDIDVEASGNVNAEV